MDSPAFQRPSAPASVEAAATASGVAGVASVRSGPASLTALFEAEEAPLLQFAYGLVGRRSVAEELVQEAFLRLHPIWSEVENPRAWLYRSLRNMALNHRRDHRRETGLEEVGEEPVQEMETAGEGLAKCEAVGAVRMLLAELPEEDRDLIRLKYHEDLKYQEIGRRTGISTGTVGYKLHHLLKGLADALRSAGIEGSRG